MPWQSVSPRQTKISFNPSQVTPPPHTTSPRSCFHDYILFQFQINHQNSGHRKIINLIFTISQAYQIHPSLTNKTIWSNFAFSGLGFVFQAVVGAVVKYKIKRQKCKLIEVLENYAVNASPSISRKMCIQFTSKGRRLLDAWIHK